MPLECDVRARSQITEFPDSLLIAERQVRYTIFAAIYDYKIGIIPPAGWECQSQEQDRGDLHASAILHAMSTFHHVAPFRCPLPRAITSKRTGGYREGKLPGRSRPKTDIARPSVRCGTTSLKDVSAAGPKRPARAAEERREGFLWQHGRMTRAADG